MGSFNESTKPSIDAMIDVFKRFSHEYKEECEQWGQDIPN